MAKGEVWFRRGSSGIWRGVTPCHWKGVVAMLAMPLTNCVVFYLLRWLLPAIGRPEWLVALFIPGLASLAGFAFLLDEHLEPRADEQTETPIVLGFDAEKRRSRDEYVGD